MWTYSMAFTAIAVWAVWTTAVGGLFWASKTGKVDQNYSCLLIVFLRSFPLTIFAYYSTIFVDSFVKTMFMGIISYGDIGYYLFRMLFALFTGIVFLFVSVFAAPTKKTLVIFMINLGIYGYYYWSTGWTTLGEREGYYIPVIYILIIEYFVGALWLILRKIIKKNPLIEPPLWNISAKIKSLFPPWIILFFWGLASIDMILMWEGYSIFGFGTGPGNTIQILIDLGIVAYVVIWVVSNKKRSKKPDVAK